MLVALVTKNCHFCDLLRENWPLIVDQLSNFTFPLPVEETKEYNKPFIYVNNNTIHQSYPSSLMRYLRQNVIDQWYPMIMIVDKEEWRQNNIKKVKIMNSTLLNDKIVLDIKYDTRIITQFKKWADDAHHVTIALDHLKITCINSLNLISIY